MDGLKTIVSFWDGLFLRCELLILGRVIILIFGTVVILGIHSCWLKCLGVPEFELPYLDVPLEGL